MKAFHFAYDPNFRSPQGAIPAGFEVCLFVEATEEPLLRTWCDGIEKLTPPVQKTSGKDGLTRYEFRYTPEKCGIVWYRFVFKNACLVPGEDPLTGAVGGKDTYESFQLTVYSPDFSVPKWTSGRVMYQIFPDRFARDTSVPLPPNRIYHPTWDDEITFEPLPEKTEYTGYDFYGGNFKGIESKLPYLSSLGVSLIYLNPVYRAASNHRYDVGDYTAPDPVLGTEKDFSDLCRKADESNIKIICDGVFSHTGDESIYFDRNGREDIPGAYQDRNSPYFSWYRFKNWPEDYACWWDVKTLPEVEEEDPVFSEFINGEKGVTRLWLKRGASGWRLDVADELPDSFLENFRKAAKAEKDAFVIGEVWEDATNKVSYGALRKYLLGAQLDSVMNYPFRRWTIDLLLGRLSPKKFAVNVRNLLSNYPSPCHNALMNFLSTHDTPRITSILGGMSETAKRTELKDFRLSSEERRLALRRHSLAAALMFTLPGIPCIFYGDELGLEGGPDPLNRVTFPENGFNSVGALRGLYTELSHLRTSPPLAMGKTHLWGSGSVLGIERTFENETATLVLDTDKLVATLTCKGKTLHIR
ncbi:MAG: glycoside hydrolase family 13 protein [Clostridia bacterium]|nr:glycoside hydrolase family 13 protein [Clostridia bacterium]